jgi:hypothetical protein
MTPQPPLSAGMTIMKALFINISKISIDDSERKVLNTGSTAPVCILRLIYP